MSIGDAAQFVAIWTGAAFGLVLICREVRESRLSTSVSLVLASFAIMALIAIVFFLTMGEA
jgi:hypothetical protein